MIRRLSLFAYLALAFATPSAAADVCDATQNFEVYDATGYTYNAEVRWCKSSIDGVHRFKEFTTGRYAPLPGQQLFVVGARTMGSKLMIGSLVRAFPNRAYPLHPKVDRVKDGQLGYSDKKPQVNWRDERIILPFVPTWVRKVSADESQPLYVYGGLVPLPGYDAKLTPLNSKSVIIGYNGFMFANANGLQGRWSDVYRDYVEIVYAQLDSNVLMRTFIPVLNYKENIEIRNIWAKAVALHPISDQSYKSDLSVAKLGAAFLFLSAMAKFSESPAGKSQSRESFCIAQMGAYHPNC